MFSPSSLLGSTVIFLGKVIQKYLLVFLAFWLIYLDTCNNSLIRRIELNVIWDLLRGASNVLVLNTVLQSICTHYSCFKNMGHFVILKKIGSIIWSAKSRVQKTGSFLFKKRRGSLAFSFFDYSVCHIITYPSKELCSKMALGEVGVSLPWWCHALVLSPPGYSGLFLNLIIFI